jgi:holliday junction DNA helicase RuvA
MIDYLNGKLTFAEAARATVEVGGIGHSLMIPLSTFLRLPQMGSALTLFVATHHSDEGPRSFGFLERRERDLFTTLINVQGVGPKTALGLIGHLTREELLEAVVTAQPARLVKVPGVGKKTADRLLLELKDKLQKEVVTYGGSGAKELGLFADAVSALVHLGYPTANSQDAVRKALQKENTPAALPFLIAAALKELKK